MRLPSWPARRACSPPWACSASCRLSCCWSCCYLSCGAMSDLSWYQCMLAIGGVVVVGVVAAMVGGITRRVVYLAATTFVFTGAFVGMVAYWRPCNEENIRGAAIIRQN